MLFETLIISVLGLTAASASGMGVYYLYDQYDQTNQRKLFLQEVVSVYDNDSLKDAIEYEYEEYEEYEEKGELMEPDIY